MEPIEKLEHLVQEVLDECWPPEGICNAKYSRLFRPRLIVHPVPFFGDLSAAEVITVAVNPSSTEFSEWRGWPTTRLSAKALALRLRGYFKSREPNPHPWFAELEEALNIIGCSYQRNAAHLDLSPRATRSMRSFKSLHERNEFLTMLRHDARWLARTIKSYARPKLVVLVGKVVDDKESDGIGVGEFLEKSVPDLWADLKGRRWPHKLCSKARLPEHVFRNRKILRDFLSSNS